MGKKRNGKNSTVIEWLDALIFAVIAVTLINIFLFQNYRLYFFIIFINQFLLI